MTAKYSSATRTAGNFSDRLILLVITMPGTMVIVSPDVGYIQIRYNYQVPLLVRRLLIIGKDVTVTYFCCCVCSVANRACWQSMFSGS